MLFKWLRNFAAQLAEAIGISTTATTSEEYFNLLIELLQATLNSKGNPEVVYPLLAANQDKLNLTFAEVLSNWARVALTQQEVTAAAGIAGVIGNFSNLITEFPLGKRRDNLEIAIVGYEIVSTVFTQAAFPVDWAMTQNNLGIAYRNRIKGEKADNIENAIACYREALKVRTPGAFPVDWAMTQNNLGIAYSYRIKGEKADNIENAIACYGEALKVYTPEAFPVNWAATQNNLGTAYSDRIKGEKADNIENAIACYREALKIRTPEAFPENWAMTQNNLGIAYWDRIKGEKADNIENAIACYREALKVRTPEAFPENYIETSSNLSLTYQIAKRFPEAEAILTPAIQAVESLREEILSGDETKQKLAEEWHKIYRRMVEVSVALGKITQALTYAERSKTRNLVENILIRDSATFFPAPILTQLNELRDKIASGQKLIQTGKAENPAELATQLKQLRQERNELQNQYLPIGNNFNLQEFQKSLPENTAIIEWYITSDRILAFIMTPNRPLPNPLLQGEGIGNTPLNPVGAKHSGDNIDKETDNIDIGMLRPVTEEGDNTNIGILPPPTPESDNLSNSISLWQSTPEDLDNLINWAQEYLYIYSKNREEWKTTLTTRLHNLAKILHIDEILQREEIKSCQRLILIPHKYLHHFPIHALPVREGVGSQESGVREENVNYQYLCDIFPQGVSYAPSCQIFLQAQQRQRPNFNHFFAIQTPTEDLYDTDLGIIPAIKPQFTTATILKRDNATKANLLNHPQLKTAHNLFFFCHGYFNSSSPLDSGLELADENLTVADIIAHLKLENCRLVTLSACESGLPKFQDSDEYLSLPYAFLLAGSTNVIATQWIVRSDATALLMLKFYQEVRSMCFSADSTEVPTTNPNQDNITLALTSAVSWLRTTTVKDFIAWVNQSPLKEGVKILLKKDFEKIAQEEGVNAQPYSEAHFWAGFAMIGKGV